MEIDHIYSKVKELKLQLQPRIKKLTDYINSSQRDKKTVYIVLAVVFLLVLIVFYNVFAGNSEKHQRQISALEGNLVKVRSLAGEYRQKKRQLEQLSGAIKKEDESLISVIEKIFIDNGIRRNRFSIKDSKLDESYSYELSGEATVQVELKEVPFKRVIDVLYSIQSRDSFLKVSNLRIRTKFNNSEMVDVSFKLSTFEIAQDM